MKNTCLILYAFLTILIITSCTGRSVSSKDQYLSRFEYFVAITEKNYMTYDDNAWVNINKEFSALSETDYGRFEKELNPEEQMKIDKLIGRFYSCVAKNNVAKMKKKLEHLYNQATEFFSNL